MPLVQVKGINGFLSTEQKKDMIAKITDAVVAIEGENLRQVTWVILEDVPDYQWGLGGKAITVDDVRKLASGG